MNRLAWVTFLWLSCFLSAEIAYPSDTTKEALIARIQKTDEDAILEAGKSGDADYIQALQGVARGDAADRRVSAARMALAKLGVKKYLDEIVSELTNSTSVAVTSGGETHVHLNYAALAVQIAAFKKLAYVKDHSTVKIIAGFLYGKENADDYFVKSDSDSSGYWDYMLIYERPSEAATKTLTQIVDNPPAGNDVKVWQQWWEQNKDKYP